MSNKHSTTEKLNININKQTKMNKNLYVELWTALLPHIIEVVEKGENHIDYLNGEVFERVGDRKSFGFRLELHNGQVNNNIAGSAVARDLYEVLRNSFKFCQLVKDKDIVIKMGKNFDLKYELI